MSRQLWKLLLLLLVHGLLVQLCACEKQPSDAQATEAEAEAENTPSESRMPVVNGHNKLIDKYNFGIESKQISDSIPSSVSPTDKLAENAIPVAERWALLRTSKGDIRILIHRTWAPRAADHFIKLVNEGFYDGAPFFTVTESLAQSGICADPELQALYGGEVIPRDPMRGSNTAGTLSLVQRDPDSRTAQFFINKVDNLFLDGDGKGNYYVPFAEVMQGLDVVAELYVTGNPDAGFTEILAKSGESVFRRKFPEGDVIEKAVMMD